VALGREKLDCFEGEREDGPNPKYAKSIEKKLYFLEGDFFIKIRCNSCSKLIWFNF
jgi:hypothetical protein